MPPPVVGLGTLRRLAALESDDTPVLSVYLTLEEPSLGPREAELPRLVGELSATLGAHMISRARGTLSTLPAFAHGTRAVALFFAADGSELELVPLPERVAPIAVFDVQPWLEPLVRMCSPRDRRAPLLEPPPRGPGRSPHAITDALLGDRAETMACP